MKKAGPATPERPNEQKGGVSMANSQVTPFTEHECFPLREGALPGCRIQNLVSSSLQESGFLA